MVPSLPPAPVTDELWPSAATSIQKIQVCPKDSPTARRQAETVTGRAGGVYAQTRGASFEAPALHHAARRGGGRMAAHGASAAAFDAGDWLSRRGVAYRDCARISA